MTLVKFEKEQQKRLLRILNTLPGHPYRMTIFYQMHLEAFQMVMYYPMATLMLISILQKNGNFNKLEFEVKLCIPSRNVSKGNFVRSSWTVTRPRSFLKLFKGGRNLRFRCPYRKTIHFGSCHPKKVPLHHRSCHAIGQ